MFFLPARRVPDMQWLELYVRFPTCRHYLFAMKQMLTPNRLVQMGDIELLDYDPVQCGGEFCVICNELAMEQYSWNVDSQNLVTATITVRVTVSYDCPVYNCPDFDCAIKTCNQGTAAPDFLAHVYCRQIAGWINMPFGMDYWGTCRPRPHCVRWEPSSP